MEEAFMVRHFWDARRYDGNGGWKTPEKNMH